MEPDAVEIRIVGSSPPRIPSPGLERELPELRAELGRLREALGES
jgi:hypothetical protein